MTRTLCIKSVLQHRILSTITLKMHISICALILLNTKFCHASFATRPFSSRIKHTEILSIIRTKPITKKNWIPLHSSPIPDSSKPNSYNLGLGKNQPLASVSQNATVTSDAKKENAASAAKKYDLGLGKNMPFVPSQNTSAPSVMKATTKSSFTNATVASNNNENDDSKTKKYDLGLGKNMPFESSQNTSAPSVMEAAMNWNFGEAEISTDEHKKIPKIALENATAIWKKQAKMLLSLNKTSDEKNVPQQTEDKEMGHSRKQNDDPKFLSRALYKFASHAESLPSTSHQSTSNPSVPSSSSSSSSFSISLPTTCTNNAPALTYDQIDFSIPASVYSPSQSIDLVWDLMRTEARTEAEREPLLVSFLFSTILNHPTLESALAFHLANRLASPTMMSTQIMSFITEALEGDEIFRRSLRADILAVRDRDPACTCLPDVFLYFKGFHALQTHRVAHYLWRNNRRVLAHFLQSQVSQAFQIDIHPNATLGSGIMLDHGTGIVIGETAVVGHNCSILHHVTLGGSGKKGNDRHPKIGNGVLLGAGASVLGNIKVGDGVQVGAGTLVIGDLPAHSVAVGVPAKIIGSFADQTVEPSIGMNQVGSEEYENMVVTFATDGI